MCCNISTRKNKRWNNACVLVGGGALSENALQVSGNREIIKVTNFNNQGEHMELDITNKVKTLEASLQLMTEAEQQAVNRYVPIMRENEELKAKNSALQQRNNNLENLLDNVKEAARAIVECEEGACYLSWPKPTK